MDVVQAYLKSASIPSPNYFILSGASKRGMKLFNTEF